MSERLDEALLAELRVLMDDAFADLLEAYLADSERRLFEVSEAWEAGDLETLRRSAHSLKGASSNIGAPELAERCGTLEHLARDRQTDAVPRALEQVRCELREVRDALESLRVSL